MIPLKITTDSSLLTSLIKIPDLLAFLEQNRIKACAICDTNLYSSVEFYIKCQEKKIKPIIGLEKTIDDKKVYLYAKNYSGYQALIKINDEDHLRADDLKNNDIKIILPYESYEIYSSIADKRNLFLGYSNAVQKKNALILSSNVVRINNARSLNKNDVNYLKYLQDLGGSFTYSENDYLDLNVLEEESKEQELFIKDINLEIPFNKRYIPIYKENTNSYDFLKTLAIKGLEKRFNNNIPSGYLERLEEELNTVQEMGFIDYFLIVYDYVLFAKKNGIVVGPGRGSAAGSLISYAVGIIDIDPIKYDLLFARFLNPYRKKMPDIDIDFEDERRYEVIKYVQQRYGKDKVALGLTFNNYKSRLILRDLAKVLKIDTSLFEKFIKIISADLSLKENSENNKDIKKYLELYAPLKELYDIASHLEGLKKNVSTHAAGVVISSVSLHEIIPVINDEDILKTGIAMDYIENMGLLKMDFLGLRNLTLIGKMAQKINDFKLENIPLDDPKVYKYLQSGNTEDLFQFESRYASDSLHKLQVKNFDELATAVALVRPGPNRQMDEYIKNKNTGKYEVHPDLKDVLKSTYGIMIYQEQVMKILSIIAGYTGPEADNVRIAMSKKKKDILAKEKDVFLARAIANGYDEEFATDLFAKILNFAAYSFNKSHSVCYAKIVYTLAYLKVNYPIIYNTVMLEEAKSSDKRKYYLTILKKNNIKILKPNINLSNEEFKFKNNYLLLPLSLIKDLPDNVIKTILLKRENGFKDIFDFILKCKEVLTPKIYEVLVLSGALDSFGFSESTLMKEEDTLFNYAAMDDEKALKPELENVKEYSKEELFANEIKYYGMYISNHPCSKYQNVVKVSKAKDYLFKNIKMALLIDKITTLKTKNGENMAFVTASDETGETELVIFPRVYSTLTDLKVRDIILINGKSSKRFDKYQIVVNKIEKE